MRLQLRWLYSHLDLHCISAVDIIFSFGLKSYFFLKITHVLEIPKFLIDFFLNPKNLDLHLPVCFLVQEVTIRK